MSLYYTLKNSVMSTISYVTATIACRLASDYNNKRKNMWPEESVYFKRKILCLASGCVLRYVGR